jgi:heme exporter protein A
MNELTAESLHLWRGEHHVLRGVSFRVAAGQCLQVTGANGSGKTTLLRALCGLVPLESGRICWLGRDLSEDPSAFHGELGYLGHDNGLKADLTAAENLRFAARLRRPVQHGEISTALERTGVADSADVALRRLSAGQRRRVALARLLLWRGAVWVLDEPGSNLDARGQSLLTELIGAHLAAGGVAVVATHQSLHLPTPQVCPLALQ